MTPEERATLRQQVKKCLGFGPIKGKCPNKAGPKSKFWCNDCEKARRAYLNQRFAEVEALMTQKP